MTDSKEFDLLILGGGPGGYAAALNGAAGNLKVGLIEKEKVGGTCLHRGCIPAKELLETSSHLKKLSELAEFGIDIKGVGFDYSKSHERKSAVVDQLHKGLSGLLKGRKVEVIDGTGYVNADGTISVTAADGTTERFSGKSTILATHNITLSFYVGGIISIILTGPLVASLRQIPQVNAH